MTDAEGRYHYRLPPGETYLYVMGTADRLHPRGGGRLEHDRDAPRRSTALSSCLRSKSPPPSL